MQKKQMFKRVSFLIVLSLLCCSSSVSMSAAADYDIYQRVDALNVFVACMLTAHREDNNRDFNASANACPSEKDTFLDRFDNKDKVYLIDFLRDKYADYTNKN